MVGRARAIRLAVRLLDSSFAARLDGISPARPATAVSSTVAPTKVIGSVGCDPVQLGRDVACQPPCRRQPQRDACRRDDQHFADHQPPDVAGTRAERDSHANLPGAPRHGVRHHPIEADNGEQRRQRAERRGHRRHEPLATERLRDLPLQCARVVDREVRVDPGIALPHHLEHAVGGVARAEVDRETARLRRLENGKNTWRGVSSRTSVYFAVADHADDFDRRWRIRVAPGRSGGRPPVRPRNSGARSAR